MKIPEAEKPGIADRLKAERERQNMTLADVGARAGCALKSINEIERCGSYSERLLRDVATALGKTVRWLRTGNDAEAPSTAPSSVRETSPLYGAPQPSVKEPEKLLNWVLVNASDKWLNKTLDDLRAAKMFDAVALVARELERRKENKR